MDKLSFLLMTVKNQEGIDIIDSQTRHGPDYDAAVRALKERYDQPRVTSVGPFIRTFQSISGN